MAWKFPLQSVYGDPTRADLAPKPLAERNRRTMGGELSA